MINLEIGNVANSLANAGIQQPANPSNSSNPQLPISPPAPTTASPTTSAAPANKPLSTAVAAVAPPVQDLSGTYGLYNGTVYNKKSGQGLDLNAFKQETGISNPNWSTLKFDTGYNPNDVNTALNAGQSQALEAANNSAPSAPDETKALAQSYIDKATAASEKDSAALAGATTGDSSIAARTKQMYADMGITAPDFTSLNQAVNDAQKEYNDIQAASISNKTNLEGNLAGTGATEGFAGSIDTRQQVAYSIQKLAAATKLQAAQQNLSSATDMFKTITGQAQNEQSAYISTLSIQLGLDKQDLSMGVSLMGQALSETNNNEQAAKTLLANLAINNPTAMGMLSAQDKQDLANGNITPNITAALGAAANQQTEKDAVAKMINTYSDAGILPTDSLDVARSKLQNSRIYQNQVRPPASASGGIYSGNAAQTAQGIIQNAPDEATARAQLNATFGPGSDSAYETTIKTQFQIPADINTLTTSVYPNGINKFNDWQGARNAFISGEKFNEDAAAKAFDQAFPKPAAPKPFNLFNPSTW